MEDRMKDILERNNAEKKKAAAETAAAAKAAPADDAEVDTWKSSWDDLLADMKISSPTGKDDDATASADAKPTATAATAAASSAAAGAKGKAGGRHDDMLDDDLDISMADLEVGTLAARRAKEKADQRARASAGDARSTSPPPERDTRAKPMKASESPDVAQVRREPPANAQVRRCRCVCATLV